MFMGRFAWLEIIGLSQPSWRALGGGHGPVWRAADHRLLPGHGSASRTGSESSPRHTSTEQIMPLQPSNLWHLRAFTRTFHHLTEAPGNNHERRKQTTSPQKNTRHHKMLRMKYLKCPRQLRRSSQ